jgi:hypothetical protein
MNRSTSRSMLCTLVVILTIAASGLATISCGVEMYPGGYYGDPTDEYVGTTEPFYYDGYPSYWYGGRWNYRVGGQWRHYDHEPRGLHDRRMQGMPGRHVYEHGGGGRGRMGGGHMGGGSHGRR